MEALFIIVIAVAGCLLSVHYCYRMMRQQHPEAHIRELRVAGFGWVGMVMAANAVLIPIAILGGSEELLGFWLSISEPTLYAYYGYIMVGSWLREIIPWLTSATLATSREIGHSLGVAAGIMCIHGGGTSIMAWLVAMAAGCVMSGTWTFAYMQKRRARQI